MKNKAHDINNYIFNKEDVFVLDTNIWLFLFPAPSSSQHSRTKRYSAAFKNMQATKVKIIVNSLILSEYLNRYCRIEFDALYKGTYSNFKKFRQSADYQSVGERAAAYAKSILKFCDKKDDDFSVIDVNQILDNFEAGVVDFTDGVIADCCLRHNWKLITDDGDFTTGGIDVITTNQKLITSCQ
ncbi:MAG: PIN domain-containing protein [Methylococcales bacterium]|nr:PIN domain-containing protein [Methylococcales bacterium]